MKTKKKDSIPSINAGRYGPLMMEWWKGLQPTWRTQDNGILSRNTPTEEKWMSLQKGGSAGIYTVVIGLSWWIKAQDMKCDADTWIMVDDLKWVIQQMYETHSSYPTGAKRAFKGREENQRATKRYILLPLYCYTIILMVFSQSSSSLDVSDTCSLNRNIPKIIIR